MPSGDIFANVTLQPIVEALTSIITPMTIVNLFATMVGACVGIILTWYVCKFLYAKFIKAVRGGRG